MKIVINDNWQRQQRLGTIDKGLDLGRLACNQHTFVVSHNPLYTREWLANHPHPTLHSTKRKMPKLGPFKLDLLLVDIPMDTRNGIRYVKTRIIVRRLLLKAGQVVGLCTSTAHSEKRRRLFGNS
jgi:hypothetical protein